MAVADAFVGLPIETLILDPILACAKGQAALAQTTLDFVEQLAFEPSEEGDNDRKAKVLNINLDRLANNPDGSLQNIEQKVQMPLLPLVTIPNFSLDTMEIDFMMEVKTSQTDNESNTSTDTSETAASVEAEGKAGWGFWSASVKASASTKTSGTVSSSKDTQRTSDQSAKYQINVKAKQNEPAEGMSKFTQILSSMIEPIDVKVTPAT
jgi:hypothetical protein